MNNIPMITSSRLKCIGIIFMGLLQSSCLQNNVQLPLNIDSQEEWEGVMEHADGLKIDNGNVQGKGVFKSALITFNSPKKLKHIVLEQNQVWNNWKETTHVGPSNLRDAPVLLSLGDKDYWMFGRYGKLAENDSLQTNGSGGEEPSLGGYHAWHSADMIHWVHHGPITDYEARWMTTAEFVDGKFYFYADIPNDTDPHLIIDENLFDGKMGKNMGLVYEDGPGSDMGIMRDLDGEFHLISENWTPINASKRAWDSPLADHAVSPDGVQPFKELAPAIDHRTTPTGEFKEYRHPHWGKGNSNKYEVHTPQQNAYGDWTLIRVGDQYHLFGDYDKANPEIKEGKNRHQHMQVGRFTTSDLNEPFQFSGTFGKGHPDPTVGFAEGQFYLISQTKDFISPGPWVDGVMARAGVDSNGDQEIDTWTDWQKISEHYNHTRGFSRVISKIPASIDLSELPDALGLQFEFKLDKGNDATNVLPIIDKIILE